MVETVSERENCMTYAHTFKPPPPPPFIISGSVLISRECCLASVALGQAPDSKDTPLTGHRYRQITSRTALPLPPPVPSSSFVLTRGLMPADKPPDVSCNNTPALSQCPVSDSLGLGQTGATRGCSWCGCSWQLKPESLQNKQATRRPETPPPLNL